MVDVQRGLSPWSNIGKLSITFMIEIKYSLNVSCSRNAAEHLQFFAELMIHTICRRQTEGHGV